MKICQIYNSAPHYRTSIFRLIDQEFECDYVFGESLGDIKQMDTSVLKGRVTKVKNHFFGKGFYWQSGVQRQLLKPYDTYVVLGDYHCLSTWLFCVRARLFHRRKRVFFWSHGWYGKENGFERVVKKVFFRLPSGGTFLYGNYARGLMIKEGFDPEKLFVIHNSLAYDKQMGIRKSLLPTDIYRKHFGNDNPVLVMIGRLNDRKRLSLLFEAVEILEKSEKQYNIVLVGDGEDRGALGLKAKELGINVWFYGACYDETINAELIYNADLCVVPGDIGLTAIHAMMFGTPVITHNKFPLHGPEFEAILSGMTGNFYEFGDVNSLADTIRLWLAKHVNNREIIRQNCFREIDTQWTPEFQIEVLKKGLATKPLRGDTNG